MSQPNAIQIADGVRRVTVGAPIGSHVYLIDDPDGLVVFDAGVRGTGAQIIAAAGEPIARVVLSHSHPDHRGGARELRAPVYCHPDEVADAEGDGGLHYADFSQIRNQTVRDIFPQLIATWDSGPIQIAGTVDEHDAIADFRVVHVPGHAPGLIALYRERDGLLLAADAVYTIDLETGAPGPARVPHPAVNWDTPMARDSVLQLARLNPSIACAGHANQIHPNAAEELQNAATEHSTHREPWRGTRVKRRAQGETFVTALAACDFERLHRCLAPDVRFRALIPPGPITATGATETVTLLRKWFGDSQDVRLIEKQVGLVGDRVSISYRLELEEDGSRVVEQHAYADVANGRITAVDLLCSGFRPIGHEQQTTTQEAGE